MYVKGVNLTTDTGIHMENYDQQILANMWQKIGPVF